MPMGAWIVMSFVAMAYFGMLPLGSVLAGGISEKIGAPNTLLLQGMLALVLAACFSAYLRKDYLDKKSKPELQESEIEALKDI